MNLVLRSGGTRNKIKNSLPGPSLVCVIIVKELANDPAGRSERAGFALLC